MGEMLNLFSTPTASWAKGQSHQYGHATQTDLFSLEEKRGDLPLSGDLFLTIRRELKERMLFSDAISSLPGFKRV